MSKRSQVTVLILNYAGRLLSAISNFWLLPTLLGMEPLGLYVGMHHIIFLLARMDLSQAIIRYGAKLGREKKEKAAFLGWVWVASTCMYILVIGASLILRPYLLPYFSRKAPDIIDYLPFIFFLGYIVLMNVTLKAYYLAQGRVVWPSVSQHVILNILLIALLGCYGWGICSFRQLLLATALPYIINLGLLLSGLWYEGELAIGWDKEVWNSSFIRSFTLYSLFTLLTSSMAMRMVRIDNIMVLGMLGKQAEAMYHTITFLALLLEIPMKVVKQTAALQIVTSLEAKDYVHLDKLYKEVTAWQFAFTSLCFVLIYTYIDYILYAFPTAAVQAMKPLFFWIGMSKMIDNICRMGSEILLLSRYFMWSMLSTALLLLGTWAKAYMIEWMGICGASIATSIVLLAGGTVSCGLIWQKFDMHPLSSSLLYWIGITTLTLTGLYCLPSLSHTLSDVGMRTALILSLYGAGLGYMVLRD